MKCEICGKEFGYGNREDGLPYGMTFVLHSGERLTMCSDCIIEKGKEVSEKKAGSRA